MSELHLIRGTPNPFGTHAAELFLLAGDATQPIRQIIFDAELPARRTDVRDFHLRILHITDLHGRISRVTAYDDTPIFSRIVSCVRETRRTENANAATIFLSAGDELVGTAFEELLCNPSLPSRFNPAHRLLSQAGLDVATLGNHEFDAGTRLLGDSIRDDARFPIVCANLANCPQLANAVFPAALLIVKGIRIGIIGLTTSAEVIHRDDPNFSIANPVTVAQNLLPLIRPLCDIVILLTHLGHSLTATTAIVCDAGDFELAQNLPAGACDVIVGGHTHIALNECGLDVANMVNEIVVAQAGANGDWLGKIEMVLNPHATIAEVSLIATNELPVDAEFEREHVQPIVAQVKQLLAEELGRVAEIETRLADFASRESEMANFITDAMVECCRLAGHAVDFAMIDNSAISCDLESGVLTFEHWFQLMPHSDVIRLYQIRCDQLQTLLDDNARRVTNRDQGFVQFSRQLAYTIDRDKAINIRVNDVPLDEQRGRTFVIACSSFTRQRDTSWQADAIKKQWPVLPLSELSKIDTSLRLRDELLAHIRAHGGIAGRRDGRVQFS
jgi:5'-nucleotidase / UDP-sugar diphosphatase